MASNSYSSITRELPIGFVNQPTESEHGQQQRRNERGVHRPDDLIGVSRSWTRGGVANRATQGTIGHRRAATRLTAARAATVDAPVSPSTSCQTDPAWLGSSR